MKRLLLFFVVLAVPLFAQNVRFEQPFPSVTTLGPVPYLVANTPPNAPLLTVCHSPANAVPCTNYATTYTGAGIACPNGAQDTPSPNSLTSACQPTGDAQGNIGFWAPNGTYDYTVCVGINCFGPYTVTLGGVAGTGTITGVTAQGPITGGGLSGGVNVGLALCPNNQVYQVIAGVWTCAIVGGNVPLGTAAQVPVVNQAGTAYVPQTKAAFDVRDSGVVCGTGIDNTAAFQNALTSASNFSELDIPFGCRIEVSATINVHNVRGLWIKAKGGQYAGVLGQQMPSVVWKGANHGGPVFDVNCAAGMWWDGFTIFLQDGISGNNADVGTDIRQVSCTQITTHNLFTNMSWQSNGANSSRVMIRIGQGSVANIEQQWFINSSMIGDENLGVFTTTQGIGLSMIGGEPFNTLWDGGSVTGLTTGFNNTSGSITIAETLGGSYTDIDCAATCFSHNNRWESSVFPWIIRNGGSINTRDDGISTLTTANPIFTLPDGGVSATLVMQDFSVGGINLGSTFNTLTTPLTGGSITILGQNILHDVPAWSNYCNFGCTVNALGTVNVLGSSVPSPATLSGIGVTLESNQSGAGNLQAISPPVNLIASYRAPDNDQFSLLNMSGALAWVHSGSAPLGPAGFGFPFSALTLAQIPTPLINSVTTHGTAGSTTYTYKIVEHSQNGTTPASAASSVATGNASLSSTNYNIIQWFPDQGMTSTDIFRTVGGATQGLIGTVLPGANNGTNWTFFFNDTGLTGDGSTAPTTNTTGQISTVSNQNLVLAPNGTGQILANAPVVVSTTGGSGITFGTGMGAISQLTFPSDQPGKIATQNNQNLVLAPNGTGSTVVSSNMPVLGPRPWIDVTHPTYGADPTGVADSTAAINSAIAACAGGTVYFPPGTYKHTGQLTFGTSCTVEGLGPLGGVTIQKAYNSTGGFPGASGSVIISASNFTLQNIVYNGNNTGGFTGPCITDATNNTNVHIRHNKMLDCNGAMLTLTAASAGATGVSTWDVLNNWIVCSSAAIAAINLQETILHGQINDNFLDCSLSVTTPGANTLGFESQGLTTTISDLEIARNRIAEPGAPANALVWGLQGGNFNAYASTNIRVHDNYIYATSSAGSGTSSSGCASFQGVSNSLFNNNICDMNGIFAYYTGVEVIGGSGVQITGNTFNGETAGGNADLVISGSSTHTITGNTFNGWGENGSLSGADAAVSFGIPNTSVAITACSESGNVATYTAASMPGQLQPGITIYFAGSFTPSGYGGGPYVMQNANYNRIAKTFSVILPTTGLGACSVFGTVNEVDFNNNITGNTFNFPVGSLGALTAPIYGVQHRGTPAGSFVSNNRTCSNNFNGASPAASTGTGVSFQGAGVSDSNTACLNTFSNLLNGVQGSFGTNNSVVKNTFVNVATVLSGTTGLYVDFLPPTSPPTITGCGAITTQLGDGFTGSFVSGQAACVPLITPGVTAVNGFICRATDLTTTADLFVQTAKSTTTCTLSATVTSGDVIQFSVRPY